MTCGNGALKRVTVLIVNFNAGTWLRQCVDALRPTGSADDPRVVIVDNGSDDNSADGFESHRVTVDRAGRNLGYAAGINRAARHADNEMLLLLNPDCRISRADLKRLVAELDEHPDTALASGRVVGEDGREQRASRRQLPTPARIVNEILKSGHERIDLTDTSAPAQSAEVEAVSGACMLVRRVAFDAIDGLDEGYPLHFEDLDLFKRLRDAGYSIRWVPDVTIVHAGGRSSVSRPMGVEIDKHRGLWRYLNRHCRDCWPVWQRPLWAVAMLAHLCLKLAAAAARPKP